MTGVEKHAQAILDRHAEQVVGPPINDHWCGACHPKKDGADGAWPCPTYQDAEAVLVAAREHNTRQAKAIACIEVIHEDHREAINANAKALGFCYAGCAGSWPCIARLESEAALRLLRGGEA